MKLFNDDNDIKELLNNLIRIGRVSSIDSHKCTARVVFSDDDEIVSYNLPVLHRNAVKNKDYNMPDIGERVLCLFLPSGVAQGFILGSVYTDSVLPPEKSENRRTVVFEDNTRVSYNRKTRHLSLDIENTKITVNKGAVTIDTPLGVTIKSGSDVTVKTPKLMVEGALGAKAAASGVITALSIATVENGIITALS